MKRVCLFRGKTASVWRHVGICRSINNSARSSSVINKAVNGNSNEKQSGSADNDSAASFSFVQPEFTNCRLIFASKSTFQLVRAYLVFSACSLDVLVNNHTKVLFFSFHFISHKILLE